MKAYNHSNASALSGTYSFNWNTLFIKVIVILQLQNLTGTVCIPRKGHDYIVVRHV